MLCGQTCIAHPRGLEQTTPGRGTLFYPYTSILSIEYTQHYEKMIVRLINGVNVIFSANGHEEGLELDALYRAICG